MFGGLCFMVEKKLCVGVDKDCLIARVGKSFYEEALKFEHCIEFDVRRKPIKGYVLINDQGISQDKALYFWIGKCYSFINSE